MKLGITMLIHNKDDIEFITEFPCFLGHPVENHMQKKMRTFSSEKYKFINMFKVDVSSPPLMQR